MKMLVFGSLNIDRVYTMPQFAQPAVTISAVKMELFCGGKGLNQSIALKKAGNDVFFAGAVGEDGGMLLNALDTFGVDHRYVQQLHCSTGHAVIQVDPSGQNSIIILPGANGMITRERADEVLSHFGKGDLIVMQNEISNVSYLLKAAHDKGMIVAFNASPVSDNLGECDFGCVDWLLVNEIEGAAIAGTEDPDGILESIHRRWPDMNIVLTLGGNGSVLMTAAGMIFRQSIFRVQAADTTGAGDTFTGFFLSEMLHSGDAQNALRIAAAASAIAVSRMGAGNSIPEMSEVMNMLNS